MMTTLQRELPLQLLLLLLLSLLGLLSKEVLFIFIGRQRELDELLVNVVVKDLQPFTIVEDVGFRAFVNKLDPTYVLPSHKALKTMVAERFIKTKEKAKEELKKAEFVSLTADMWSSINMDGYLGLTCHYITPEAKMATVLLGVQRFHQTHTAQHIMEAEKLLMAEWGIASKVQCMVTDNAANMSLSTYLLGLRHIPCFAHSLNLIVKKSLDQEDIGNGHVRRERVFHDYNDFLAHDDDWLISRFRFPRSILLELCAELSPAWV
ncbi:hypothetical protein ACEWY4_022875 [Coilia grayii]|uniref:Transposase n=1 Tax=Coilia grayii TaxID=363190 RepID=A0ABD1J1L0_9TELE